MIPLWISINKGLSTAEGARGHVTTYMYCVTIKIQMLRPDILKIVINIWSYTMCGKNYRVNAQREAVILAGWPANAQWQRDEMSTRSRTATSPSPLRVASGQIVKKHQQIRARPSPLCDNVQRRLLAKIGGTSWSSLAYWALGWAKLLVYHIAYHTARMRIRVALALMGCKRQPLSGLWLLLNIDTVWILMGHVVTCPLPPSAVDKPLVLVLSYTLCVNF